MRELFEKIPNTNPTTIHGEFKTTHQLISTDIGVRWYMNKMLKPPPPF